MKLSQNLNKYYENEIKAKIRLYVEQLASVGIEVAYRYTDDKYKSYIMYAKTDAVKTSTGYCSIFYGKDIAPLLMTWWTEKGERGYEISPILMAEFGSGFHNENLYDVQAPTQGSMPKQIHAMDPNGWYWTDEDGNKHHSIGELPTHPMYMAYLEMVNQVDRIAREVFG
jgi:hypothetical protein